jgi:UDP:flavonoid glycosyltransferase YjiC (YdhE family)
MVPLIRAAQRRGHDVVVSSGADLSELIARLGVTAHRSGVTLSESYARMPDQVTISELPPDQQAGFAARHLFGAGAIDRARDLRELMREWPPDLVVHDTLELGAPTVAIMRRVPHVTHGYGPIIPPTSDFAAAIGAAITDAGLPDPVPAVFAAPYLDVCPPGLHGSDPSPWPTMYPLRPSAGEFDDGLPPEFDALPHPHTVYVTLGTIMNQNVGVFRAVIDGCARWPVNLIVTTGPGLDAAQLGPLPAAVLAAPFLPQAAVLPRCEVVVSHAGAGTMLGALCYGLPQLCLPQGTDQPFNTAALLPTGAALALQPDEITADRVADALGQLLQDPSFRDAARRLRDQIAHMPTPGTVLDHLLREAAGPARRSGPSVP